MPFEVVAVGASLGGFSVLKTVLGGLRPDFPAALLLVQHQGAGRHGALAARLQDYCTLPVREPEDKEPLRAGHVYVAPAGYHLLVERDRTPASPMASAVGLPAASLRASLALTTEGPVQYARPSIDVLFESVADSYGRDAIGVAMTSSTEDGVRGLACIKARGGMVLVQDPNTAESRVLPDATLAHVAVDRVLPPAKIAAFLALTCHLSHEPQHLRNGATGATGATGAAHSS